MRNEEIIFTLDSIFNLGKVMSSVQSPDEIVTISILSLMGKLKMKRSAGFVLKGDVFKPVYLSGVKVQDNFKINPDEIPTEFTKLKRTKLTHLSAKLKNFIRTNGFDYLVPVKWETPNRNEKNLILGLIFLGGRDAKISKAEVDYIEFISNFTAISLKNIFSILDLKRSIYNLSMLNEFTQGVFLKNNESEIFNFLALTLMGHFKVKSTTIVIIEDGKMKFFSFPKRKKFQMEILKKILKEDKSVIVLPTRFRRDDLSIVIVDRSRNEKVGILLLGDCKLSFEDDELKLIQTFFSVAISAVENLKMLSLSYDIKLAYEIQQNLLPKDFFENQKIEICGLTIPSKIVSGDYYDVIRLNDDEIIVVIADVCGKGLSASLLMSNLQASLRSFLFFTEDVREIAKLLNKVIIANTSPEQFITFFICKIDLKNFIVEYVNAGHEPPILIRGDEVKLLNEGGAVFGVFEGEYESEKFKVNSGDLLFLYTDGVTEAVNLAGEELGVKRIIETLKSTRKAKAVKIIKTMRELILEHSRGVEQMDDITMTVIKLK